MIEKQMIRLMLNKKFYTEYKGVLSPSVFAGDISSLYDTVQKAHEKYEEDIKLDELYSLHTTVFNPALTRAAKEKFSELIEDIKEVNEPKKEILDSWNSWKYDIVDMNRSEWTQRDQSILDTIELLLRKEYGDVDKSR